MPTVTESNRVPIESGIPLPPKYDSSSPRPGKCIYPWYVMQPKESFFIPRNTSNVGTHMRQMAKQTGFKYVIRPSTKDGVQGTRVWRVK